MSADAIAINLLPATLRTQAARRRQLHRWGVVTASAALLAAVAAGSDWRRGAELATLANEQARLRGTLTDVRSELEATAEDGRRVRAEIQRAEALRTKRGWSGLIALLSKCLPAEVWLVSIATEPPVPASGSAPRPVVATAAGGAARPGPVTMTAPTLLNVVGYAVDHERLYEFMAALKQSNVFTRLELMKAGAEPFAQGAAVRFQLVCGW